MHTYHHWFVAFCDPISSLVIDRWSSSEASILQYKLNGIPFTTRMLTAHDSLIMLYSPVPRLLPMQGNIWLQVQGAKPFAKLVTAPPNSIQCDSHGVRLYVQSSKDFVCRLLWKKAAQGVGPTTEMKVKVRCFLPQWWEWPTHTSTSGHHTLWLNFNSDFSN